MITIVIERQGRHRDWETRSYRKKNRPGGIYLHTMKKKRGGGERLGGTGHRGGYKKKKKQTRVIEEVKREGRFCKRMILRVVRIC